MVKKIAIDISPLNDGNAVRGVGHYTHNLVNALKKEIKSNPDYKNYQLDLIQDSRLKIEDYALVHYPYFDPFKLSLPQKIIPTIVTVHDLIPRQFKSNFPVGLKGEIRWLIQKSHLKKADYLITPSHYSKHVIADITKYPVDKIYVTPEAATPDFKPIKDPKLLKSIKSKYKLPQKFILFVGDINWNKNLPSLIDACIYLEYPLVIVGSAATKKDVPKHPWTADIHYTQAQIQKHPKLIIPTGFVPEEDLPMIFNLATIYCQPSYAEGFGLPVVQALQSGTPVAYSQESCLNEIMDYNGQMFNPYSLSSLKNALITLWKNPKLRQEYSQNGIKRAQIFNWQYTAIQTLAVYDLILKYETE